MTMLDIYKFKRKSFASCFFLQPNTKLVFNAYPSSNFCSPFNHEPEQFIFFCPNKEGWKKTKQWSFSHKFCCLVIQNHRLFPGIHLNYIMTSGPYKWKYHFYRGWKLHLVIALWDWTQYIRIESFLLSHDMRQACSAVYTQARGRPYTRKRPPLNYVAQRRWETRPQHYWTIHIDVKNLTRVSGIKNKKYGLRNFQTVPNLLHCVDQGSRKGQPACP